MPVNFFQAGFKKTLMQVATGCTVSVLMVFGAAAEADTVVNATPPPEEVRTLSPEATSELLGDDLSYVIAYNKNGKPILFGPQGKKIEQYKFPLPYPPNEILDIKTTTVTTIKAAAKCVIYIGGKIYCIPCS